MTSSKLSRFLRSALAGLSLFALPAIASAQTSPNFTYGFVPTTAQWNSYFAAKQDYLGARPCIVSGCIMTGLLTTVASTTTTAGFNVPPGTAPTAPNNGDMWSTTSGFYVRVNGFTVGPLAAGTTGSFAATSPITVSAVAGVVTYGFNFTVANTFLAQQTNQGATTTSPGWYTQLAGDTFPRVRVGLNATDVASVAFGPGSTARDTFIERAAAATLRFGAPDAAAPVAQTIGVQNVVAGTANTAGANFTVSGSQGTGTGIGGSILFKTAAAGSTGSAVNSLSTVLTLDSTGLATFARSAVFGAPTGGDKGVGTVNAQALVYSGGNAVAASATTPIVLNATTGVLTCPTCLTGTGGAITAGLTTTSGFSSGQVLYSNGSTVQAASVTGSLGNVVLSVSPTLTGTAVINAAAIGGATIGSNVLAVTGTSLHTGATTVASSAAAALSVGANGATNPALTVDASTASSATGLKIKSAAAAGGLALSVTTSGTTENLTVDAAGSGTITVGGTSTGAITLTRATTISAALTYGAVTFANTTTGTAGSSLVGSISPTITGHMTVEGVTATGATGTGNFVFATAPSVSSLTVTTAFTATGLVAATALTDGFTGSGAFARASNATLTTPSIGSPTITTSFTATGLVKNADLVNASTTVNGQTCTLGLTCTITATAGAITVGTTTVTGGPGLLYNATTGGTLTAATVTSGGIPYGSSATAITFSAALTANGVVLGGGAAGAPTSTAAATNGQILVGVTSSAPIFRTASGDVSAISSAGAFTFAASNTNITSLANLATVGTITSGTWQGTVIAATYLPQATNAALGAMRGDGTTISCTAGVCQALGAAATSISVGTTTIASGTGSYLLYNNAGTLGNATVASFLSAGTQISISGTTTATISLNSTTRTRQVFTSGSGTYTTPAGVKSILIRMQGAGSGGGGGGTSGGTTSTAGNTCWNTSGAACTTPVYAANGGNASSNSGAGPSGGTASGGDVNIQGGAGGQDIGVAVQFGGHGGTACWGGGGTGGYGFASGSGPGTAASANSGAGGGGGGSGTGNSGGSGGAAGGCLEKLIAAPAGTYTYAVGAGTAGGTAGTGGSAGAAGASGIIIVDEVYQ